MEDPESVPRRTAEEWTVHPLSKLVSEARPSLRDSDPALPLRLEVTA